MKHANTITLISNVTSITQLLLFTTKLQPEYKIKQCERNKTEDMFDEYLMTLQK